MGSKYSQHILDPQINQWSYDLATKGADYFNGLADKTYINNDLAGLGQGELSAIKAGRTGDTMYAKMLRNAATRGNETLKNSMRLGAGAMARGATGSNASSIYQRMLANAQSNSMDNYADQLAQNMPSYVNQAGDWAEAANRGYAQQANFKQMGNQALQAGAQMRQSNMVFEKKKSLWDKIKEGVSVAGQIAGIATGFGGLTGMIPKGGGGPSNAAARGANPGNVWPS